MDFFTSNIASAINVHQKYKLNPINAKRKIHIFSIFVTCVLIEMQTTKKKLWVQFAITPGYIHTHTHYKSSFRCKFINATRSTVKWSVFLFLLCFSNCLWELHDFKIAVINVQNFTDWHSMYKKKKNSQLVRHYRHLNLSNTI